MPKYVKGQPSANPKGRPKGSKSWYTIDCLKKAIKKVESEKGINLFEHFLERALYNDTVLIALMKKIIPDITHNSITSDDELKGEMIRLIPSNGNGDKSRLQKFLDN